jgi:hypothetical protein
MFVHKRDCIAGPGFDDGVVEDLAQVVCRTALAHVVEVVVQQYVEERGLPKNDSLLGARAQEREMTCESSIAWTNPQKSWMHGRIRFMLRYKSVAESQCVHVILDVVVSRERCNALGGPVLGHGKHARLPARMSGACKLTKV